MSLRGSVGYKDNVLLGNVAPEGGPFLGLGLDLMVFRIPTGNTEFLGFVSGDDRRYLNVPGIDKERDLIAQTQLKQTFGDNWKAALTLQYVFQDQVFDVSTTEAGFGSLKLEGHALTLRPSLRRSLGSHAYLEGEFGVTRQYFPWPIGNYWEGGPKLTLGYTYGNSSELALRAILNKRFYGQRPDTALDATPIPNTSLTFLEPGAELVWDHIWDPDKQWRTTTKFTYRSDFDNGPGFYDFHRFGLSQRIRFQTKSWQLSGEARIEDYAFRLQPVSDTDPTKKYLLGLGFELRVEKKLSKAFRVFVEYDYDRLFSNQTINEYAANTVATGVEWEY